MSAMTRVMVTFCRGGCFRIRTPHRLLLLLCPVLDADDELPRLRIMVEFHKWGDIEVEFACAIASPKSAIHPSGRAVSSRPSYLPRGPATDTFLLGVCLYVV